MTREPATLRNRWAERGAGVVWCHTTTYAALDDLLTQVEQAHDPRILRVVVTPDTRNRPTTLATDVAVALGVHPGAAGKARSEVQMHQLVPLLLEHPVEDLLLGSAWWAHPRCLEELTVMSRAAGVTLWLLGSDPFSPADAARWHGLGVQVATQEVLNAFADITEPAPAGPVPLDEADPWGEVTSVPSSDFVTFLADARDQLPPERAQLVEATLRAEHARAQTWFANHPDSGVEAVADALHQRWNTCVSWPEFLTLIRGWQIAAFHTGRLLKVSPDQLAGTATTVPSARQRTREQWQRLWAWHEPCRSAACALVAAGLGSEDAVSASVSQVSTDGATVTRPDGEVVTIEAFARPFMRAALYERLLDGAEGGDPFLVTAAGVRPAARWVVTQANNARNNFGLPLASGSISNRSTGGDRWATRWGLSLIELT